MKHRAGARRMLSFLFHTRRANDDIVWGRPRLNDWATTRHEKLSRFDTIPERDRQTDKTAIPLSRVMSICCAGAR